MKIKRIITITIFILFLASVAVFVIFGAQIRAALSPEITYDYPVMQDIDGNYTTAVPASAVWYDENGEPCVWTVSRSDDFPESAYVVTACPIGIEFEADGMVYLNSWRLSSSDAIAVNWQSTLRDGMCVRPKR